MKFPICKVCLKNEMICNGCAEKVGELDIKTDELKTFRLLSRILKKYDHLKGIEIKRAIDSKNMLLLITSREDASKLIGKNGGMVKKLGKELGKQIRVIGELSDIKKFVDEIFFSTPILGINVLYTSKKKKYKIRMPSSERVVLPITPEKFSSIANSVLGVDAELVFD